MAETFKISPTGLLIQNNRAFLPSANINIFPCSRRGQAGIELPGEPVSSYEAFDPEARLNTERTNRLHTAINGFKDSFIINNTFVTGDTLTFVLAGYRIEVKSFNPATIADELNITNDGIIYAYLSLHTDIYLNVPGYHTEILYRQSTKANDKNYLDVFYSDTDTSRKNDFFVGVSFTADRDAQDNGVTPYVLPLFSKVGENWKLVETSKLPKIEHDAGPDSIKLSGDFTVVHPVLNEDGTPVLDTDGKPETQESFKVTKDETVLGPTVMSSLIVGEKADGDKFLDGTIKAPALAVETIKNDSTEAVTVDDDLTVTGNLVIAAGKAVTTDTVNVNTINSRHENGTITVESPVTLKGNATLNNGLEVTNGNTSLKKLAATELKVATDALTVTEDGANFTKPVTVENSLTTNNVQIKDQGQVPALELYHFKNGPYQLRFKFNTAPTIIEEE